MCAIPRLLYSISQTIPQRAVKFETWKAKHVADITLHSKTNSETGNEWMRNYPKVKDSKATHANTKVESACDLSRIHFTFAIWLDSKNQKFHI